MHATLCIYSVAYVLDLFYPALTRHAVAAYLNKLSCRPHARVTSLSCSFMCVCVRREDVFFTPCAYLLISLDAFLSLAARHSSGAGKSSWAKYVLISAMDLLCHADKCEMISRGAIILLRLRLHFEWVKLMLPFKHRH